MSEVMTSSNMDHKGTLSNTGEGKIVIGLSVLMQAVTFNNYEKGWRTPDSEPRAIPELCALLHSEVTEAFEAYRNGEPPLWYQYPNGIESDKPGLASAECLLGDHNEDETVLGKPQGIASELADVIIRVMDMAQEHDIPILEAVINKHKYNQTRPYRHGGKLV